MINRSRPRFWIYLLGPFLVGLAATESIFNPDFFFLNLMGLLYFTLPANFILYAVNDLSDIETDRINPKKLTKESVLDTSSYSHHLQLIFFFFIISFLYISIQPNLSSQLTIIFFLILSISYSLKPIRFKAKPILDSTSNFLYVLPLILSFNQAEIAIPIYLIFAGLSYTAAMHLFSAIPDIASDSKVGLLTSAVFLGKTYSLFTCALLWLLFSIFLFLSTTSPLSWLTLIYALIPLIIFFRKKTAIDVYWYFPVLNFIVGFGIFLSIIFHQV